MPPVTYTSSPLVDVIGAVHSKFEKKFAPHADVALLKLQKNLGESNSSLKEVVEVVVAVQHSRFQKKHTLQVIWYN